MKKPIKLYLLLVFVAIVQFSFGQKQEKIYYDKDWKGVSQSSAEFYRIVNYDENGKPNGKVKDYYITGELQSEIDGALSIDKNDDSKSKFTGFSRGFFKSGTKEFEILHDNQGKVITHKIWFANGNPRMESAYKNENLDGNYILYHENGTVFRKFTFTNGNLASKFFLECDEFSKCQNVFIENFQSSENVNQWFVGNSKDVSVEILSEKGILMKDKGGNGFRNTINIPLELSEDFSIETIIDFKNGESNNGHGLMWGFKDWQNFSSFAISANGFYRIDSKAEGIDLPIKEWTKTATINQNKQRNLLKILRIDDKIYFSINGQIVHSDKFYSFRGNNIGFYLLSGKKEVLFENLIVKQDVSNSNHSVSRTTNSNSEWKGNGSGFFIDQRGYIATNYHVIKDANQIEINFIRNGQQQSFNAEVIQSDRQNDLAILKITDNAFKPFTNIPYNFQTNLSDVGTNIFALGYPMADVMGSEIKFTDGKISSKTGIQGDITMYQISVPIQSGNSGGALFDYDGNLVGITSAGLNRDYFNSENVNYAIKTSYLKNLTDVLPISVKLPNDKTIASKTLTEKIKILSDYVVLIKIR